jgi:hypothetical protein
MKLKIFVNFLLSKKIKLKVKKVVVKIQVNIKAKIYFLKVILQQIYRREKSKNKLNLVEISFLFFLKYLLNLFFYI